jgi:UPF0755 protein
MRRAFLILLLFLLAVVAAGAWLGHALYAPYAHFADSGVFVDIPKGTALRGVARMLSDAGVIRSRWAFLLLARRHPSRYPQAGEYFFSRPENAFAVFDTLASGRVFTISVTVPEGFNTLQIAALLEQQGLVARDAFLAAVQDTSSIRDLAPNAPSMEGFLFPSTYQFPHHVSAQQIVQTMTAHFRAEWTALAAADPSDGRPPLAVVTLASLVESETPKPEERPLVARVFVNRLNRGLPLQCDPTVIYALELAGKYSPPLSGRDLRFNSAYNTYRHLGLPPGPITNPGEASLRAALEPADVDYLYFVADTQGGHLFSRTLAEHNRNVARYRHLRNQPATTGKPGGQPPASPREPQGNGN